VLGVEPDIIANYVNRGVVKIVFWPVLNHGDPSLYSTLTAECVAQQDMGAFWHVHKLLFENQQDLWSASRDYYVETAVRVGADQATFEACYDGPLGIDNILVLDNLRRQRGIFSQPVFDVNGQLLAGRQSFDLFATIFDEIETTP
jgi:protein-disulfide isomerase